MTLAAVLFLVGVGVGCFAERLWSTAVEVFDIYREQGR